MTAFTLNVAAGLVASAFGFVLGALFERMRVTRKLRHIKRLIPSDYRIQIVLPSAKIDSFHIKGSAGKKATQPPNVLMMPMSEGNGVAELVLGLRSFSRKVDIRLTTDKNVSHDYKLTFSVGGPSVNLESKRLISLYPNFEINYPEHVASHGLVKYEPKKSQNGNICEDFGFVIGRTENGSTSIVFCGVWGAGTEAAIKGFASLSENKLSRRIKDMESFFLAFRIVIDDLTFSEPVLTHSDDGEQFITWRQ